VTDEDVVYEVAEGIATIRLQRPEKLNGFTLQMVGRIRDLAATAARDPEVGAVVVTGTGRGFSAGLDAGDLARSTSGQAPSTAVPEGELPALFSFLLNVPKPVVAAVNGVCAGGGFVLAMMCDVRFAAPEASFTTIFARRGLVAEHGTAWFLPRLVGTSRALDLLWSSRRIDATEAHRIGLVDHIVPTDELLPATRAYLSDLFATASPRSLAVMKEQVYRGWSQGASVALADDDRQVQASLLHPDAAEGALSLQEKRPAKFARFEGL
jgi:enoyl-CoA hydratase/carnithine racemase